MQLQNEVSKMLKTSHHRCDDWFETLMCLAWPRPRTYEPLIYRLHLTTEKVVQVLSATVRAVKTF
jgi:hypothetical protein